MLKLVARMLKLLVILSTFKLCIIIFKPTKLFTDLHLAKFLDTSIKLFFPCTNIVSFSFKLKNQIHERNVLLSSILNFPFNNQK